MAQPVIQTNFSVGELAPSLFARVDLSKYHSAVALAENWFVDYRGGLSTCVGTKYINQAYNSSLPVRLIPFAASFTVNYVLEFGQGYIRFINNAAYVLQTAGTIAGITQANPAVVHQVAHGYLTGDWVYLLVTGMTQVNAKYFQVLKVDADHYSLQNLNGVAIDSTAYGAFVSGTAARVYTLQSPYAATDLALLKFAQNVQTMVLTHPSYVPYILTLFAATNWTLVPINFTSSIAAPTGLSGTSNGGTGVNYAYEITAVDINGQESVPSAIISIANAGSTGTNSNTLGWAAVPGAIGYNVYKAEPGVAVAIATGAAYGFIGSCTGIQFVDGNGGFAPDFGTTPPIAMNPFQGAGVVSYTVTVAGTYTTVPSVIVAAAPAGGSPASAAATLQPVSVAIASGGLGFSVGQILIFPGIAQLVVATVNGSGTVLTFQPLNYPGTVLGSFTGPGNAVTSNPVSSTVGGVNAASINGTWGVTQVQPVLVGSGYTSAPAVTFSAGAAAATAVLGTASAGNPSVPAYFQQRLVLAGPPGSPQQFNMSQPGSYYNYNVSDPAQADDAISGQIVSGQLNVIKALLPMPNGLITMTSTSAWNINGGSAGATITPLDATAQAQAFNGISDVPPIRAVEHVLYVQSKGSRVRDLAFNFYTNVYTGTDISLLSYHLVQGHQLTQWAYSEEPNFLVWSVRDDGILLCLTYVKEQEIVGWTHRNTLGLFQSVCTVTEAIQVGNSTVNVDATYVVAERAVNGNVVQYIERMADRFFYYGVEDAWAVDAALQTSPYASSTTNLVQASQSTVGTGVIFISGLAAFGAGDVGSVLRVSGGIATITAFTSSTQVTGTLTQAITATLANGAPLAGAWGLWKNVTAVSGLDQLEGQPVVGLADGVAVGPLTVTSGSVTLASPASKVTLGLSFIPKLQTLQLDTGEPTIQGKRKKIPAVTVRVQDTLGLSIGSSFTNLVPMKDLVVGNVGTMSNQIVTNLVTGDARTLIDPLWAPQGQYCLQQSQPYPATVLGVIPEVTVGDTPK